jgi:hypothetical protein
MDCRLTPIPGRQCGGMAILTTEATSGFEFLQRAWLLRAQSGIRVPAAPPGFAMTRDDGARHALRRRMLGSEATMVPVVPDIAADH